MVKFIDYKNEKLPISISFFALEKLEGEGLKLDDGSFKAMKRLFWFGLVAGHFHENKELEIEEQNSGLILDLCFAQFQELLPFFLESLNKKKVKTKK